MIDLPHKPKASPTRIYLALTCAVSVLAACSQGGSNTTDTTGNATENAMDNSLADAAPPATALPLAQGAAPAAAPAPIAAALPPAPSVPLGRVPQADQYAYLNQAYDFSQSLADAPPDYTYDYQGEQPMVWQSPDGYYRVAERLPTGVRYFYYAPGAPGPYFVQDPRYSYGYSQGMLTAVYGPGGEILPYDIEARQAQAAGVYLAWAAGLYAAARHDQHVAVSQTRWDAERQAVYADQARWNAGQRRNAAWAAYGQAHQNDEAHWAAQRYARAAEAARFAQTVHDETALARAQQAAVDARGLAQSRGERLPGAAPGPAQGGDVERRETRDVALPAAGAGAAALIAAHRQQAAQQRIQALDHAQTQAHAEAEARVQAAAQGRTEQTVQRQAAAQSLAQARTQHEAQAAASREAAAQAHAQRAAAHQAESAAAAQKAAADHAQADAHRQAAEQAAAQAAEARKAAEAQAHAQAAHPAPHSTQAPAAKAPAKSDRKPDEPHP